MGKREVSVSVYSCDGAWWCRLSERVPARREDWPGHSQCMLWSGSTPGVVLEKCREFLGEAAQKAANANPLVADLAGTAEAKLELVRSIVSGPWLGSEEDLLNALEAALGD